MSKRKLFTVTIFLIGVHSILLGIFIYFNTSLFYRIFFNAEISNLFFVKQSGLFLVLLGLFYLVPLVKIERMYAVSVVTIISKILAVLFLLTNAGLTPDSKIIYLAAIGDGLMAIALSITYLMFVNEVVRIKNETL